MAQIIQLTTEGHPRPTHTSSSPPPPPKSKPGSSLHCCLGFLSSAATTELGEGLGEGERTFGSRPQ